MELIRRLNPGQEPFSLWGEEILNLRIDYEKGQNKKGGN